MKSMQFKTSLKCSGCVEKVTPDLNKVVGEQNWKVDLQSPDKVLTIPADKVNKADIIWAFEKAGFVATPLV